MPRAGVRELINLSRVVASGRLMHNGENFDSFTTRFETQLKTKIGVKHALTVNSGTSALIVALVAAGIGPGDEVLVPAYTWVSTAAAPLAVGAVPILVDVDETLTMDPHDMERKITPNSKAVIPVHMLNLACNMDAIAAIAKRHRLVVIEDACQAMGVSYKGRRLGSIGDFGCYSFNHYKNISSGEGGAIVTNNDSYSLRARVYHDIGTYSSEYGLKGEELDFVGVNFRVSELTGAVLCAQLPRLDRLIDRLKSRRRSMIQILSCSKTLRISPHNDPENAAGLTVVFATTEEAEAFARNHGVQRIFDIGRHAYTDWLSVLTQRKFQDRANPFRRAEGRNIYFADMCGETIDILKRSCLIDLSSNVPCVLLRARARRMLRSL